MARWFRAYDDALHDPKVQSLPPILFKFWFNLLCVASKYDGLIPPLSELQALLKARSNYVEAHIQGLLKRGLIDEVDGGYEPHNWRKFQYKSDSSTDRVRAHRDAKRNVSETPPDNRVQRTDTEKKDPAAAGSSSNVVPFTPDAEPDPEDSYEDQFWAHEKKCAAAGIPKSMMGQLAQLHGGDFHTALLNLKDALRAKGPRPYLAKTIQNIRREHQVAEAPKPTADGTMAWCGDKLKPGYGDTWM